ncbi:MAG: hypothetical protein WCH46_06375 [bacterium]
MDEWQEGSTGLKPEGMIYPTKIQNATPFVKVPKRIFFEFG